MTNGNMTLNNLNIMLLANATYEFPNSLCYNSTQYTFAILRYPYYMIFAIVCNQPCQKVFRKLREIP